MNNTLRNVLIGLAIFVVGATLFYGGMYFARSRTTSFNWGYGPGMMGGYTNPNYDQTPYGYGPGWSGGGGMMGGGRHDGWIWLWRVGERSTDQHG
jgi:hypothetical protein